MELHSGLFNDIVILFVAAFLGGIAARLIKMPTLLGYLAAGVLVGPHAFELISNEEAVQTIAELGVILLLFAVGVEISPADMLKLGQRVIVASLGQLLITGALGFALGVALGWSIEQAVVLSFVMSLSSTMVVLKTLTDRGEVLTLHGRVMTGMLVMQDLAFVPMIAVIPALSGDTSSLVADVSIGALKAAAVLGVVFVIGGRVIPWVLRRAAGFGTRETFIVTVVAISVGAAAITQSMGLSAALGAFAAGLAISGSDWTGHRALEEVIPLRDIFAAMFFASLGMLTDPAFFIDNLGVVLVVVAASILLKFVVIAGMVRIVGYLPRTALLSGIGMIQIGEFSFILAGAAALEGVVNGDFLPLVIVAAVATMAITPGVIAGGTQLVTRMEGRWPWLRAYVPGRATSEGSEDRIPRYRDHVVVAGLGRVGAFVAQELHREGIPFIGLDVDPAHVEETRERWGYAIQGDSSSEVVLRAARLDRARLLVIATADPVAAAVTVQHARSMNPSVHIIARISWLQEGQLFHERGVQAVVWPEMEAAIEMLRLSLVQLGVSPDRVANLIDADRKTVELGEVDPEHDPYAGLW